MQSMACPSGKPPCSQDGFAPVSNSPIEHKSTVTPGDLQALQDSRTATPSLPPLAGGEGTAVLRWASSRTVREAMFESLARFECPIASGTITYEFELSRMEREGSPGL